ncbi:HpcH/HpaI aldolase family protein [Ammoniphilus resinae]|uniref:4-hydroxy-2-oxoheptanedioate aldolase n=1 Tax=Ammoniphilus resinae TaxID=861532 RepID=A0ABS4GPD8_9BACL|nr:aldolase/citrate lyase family protein [Ammoniphilus resinae]MBP1931927.1 4-hydroxy-2-oxoheptanedioate aldolase [Ammoniphilus resinae]
MVKNRVKEKIKQGEKVLGCFLNIYSPALVELMGYAGFDFIVIDNEHGGFSDSELENLIRAAECVDIVPIIRIAYDPSSIQKALDRGARGIQVPMVNTKEDAERIVKLAKYPPFGTRGAAFSIRPAKYGRISGEQFLDHEDENTMIIVHIETPEAARNFEEIIQVPGIDVAFIGPTDLSVNMGYKKEGSKHPDVQKTIQEIYDQAKKMNFPVGTIAPIQKDINRAIEQGNSYVVGVGSSIFLSTFDNYVGEWEKHKI